jgi:hypothetical protein
MMLPQETPLQYLEALHRANRLLAALEPDDFTGLDPHLELIELTRGLPPVLIGYARSD